ncbi:MAG: type II toxin-antitoxin system ParD family antitoxin [Zoogloeaceae bacterium]|nr:type II toxin-antitoxin system ParD family antitoxin [Zoogloeaceae bacterium]
MPTRNVVLTTHQASFVEHLVATGRYQNASEILREGLRLIEDREREAEKRLQVLREAVASGMEDITAGRYEVIDSAEALTAFVQNVTEEALAHR